MRPLIAGHVLEKVVIQIKLEAEIIICKPVNQFCTYVEKINETIKKHGNKRVIRNI